MATVVTEPSASSEILGNLKAVLDGAAQSLAQFLKQDVADLESGVTKSHVDQDELSAALKQFEVQRGQRKQDLKRSLNDAEQKVSELVERWPNSTWMYRGCTSIISSSMEKAERCLARGWKVVVDERGRSLDGAQNQNQHAVIIVRICAQEVLAISSSVQNDVDRLFTSLSGDR